MDRFESLIELSDAVLTSPLLEITDGARKVVWYQYRRFQLTRLETRTKEFIRMCEYVTQNGHMRNESER